MSRQAAITITGIDHFTGEISYQRGDDVMPFGQSAFTLQRWMNEQKFITPFYQLDRPAQEAALASYLIDLNAKYGTADDAHLESERDNEADYRQHKLTKAGQPVTLASAHNGHISDRALEMDTLMNIQAEEDENNVGRGFWLPQFN